ncbi:MAG: hypothetical protein KC731_10000, partial [Myxococcales bacterium]|nr:hypothetical protein [Myxococcales bacterium]
VADFGLARAIEEGVVGTSAPTGGGGDAMRALTRGGDVAGTPAYMAPEQYLGTAQDERSDQFAFCVSLYEALTGHKPFMGSTLAQLQDAILTAEPPPPGGHDTPDILVRAVSRGLSKNRRDRFASMGELAALLESLTGDVDLSRVCRDDALRSGLFHAPMYDQYVRDLPDGLATDPDARVPNRLTRVALAQMPLEYPPAELVPIIAGLRRDHVVSPVHARAILCALYDEHFRALEPWTAFMGRVSRSLMQLAFVGFSVLSPAAPQYVHSVVATYNNLVKGTPVQVVDEGTREAQTATIAFEHPSESMNEVIRVVLVEGFRAVMLASGCCAVEVAMRRRAEDSFELEIQWQ